MCYPRRSPFAGIEVRARKNGTAGYRIWWRLGGTRNGRRHTQHELGITLKRDTVKSCERRRDAGSNVQVRTCGQP
jgi:hypothetical protein